MAAEQNGLETLLSPIFSENFLSDYSEKKMHPGKQTQTTRYVPTRRQRQFGEL
jgi:hypothetical protein